MELAELVNEEMYVLVAPDGNPQVGTLAPDLATCVAVVKMQHKAGLGQSYHELMVVKGFKILPVKVTLVAVGTEEEGFKKAKENL